MRNFYRMVVDPRATTRWYLKAPVDQQGKDVDPRMFTRGVPVECNFPLSIPLRQQGEEVDINFSDFDMLVVSRQVIDKLEFDFDLQIQRISVDINGNFNYEIINPLALISCVDEDESDYIKWTEDDGRPDKIGQFRMFLKMKVKKDLPANKHFFRVAEWPVALLVSEELKNAIESCHASGVAFSTV